jgi:hypothetical protein
MAMLGVKIEDCQGQTVMQTDFYIAGKEKTSPPGYPKHGNDGGLQIKPQDIHRWFLQFSFSPPLSRDAVLPHIPLYNPNMSRSLRPTAGGCLARPIPLLPFRLFLKVSL